MSYRKITVDGKVYEYTVGDTHLKVKGVGVFPKEEFGKKVEILCECCGEPLSSIYSQPPTYRIAVTPADIARTIRAHV